MTHSAHIQSERIADEIRWERTNALLQSIWRELAAIKRRSVRGCKKQFEKVILDACKPADGKDANNLHLNGGGLDGLITDAVMLARSQTRNKTEAAKKLKVSRGWLLAFEKRKAVSA